MTVMPTVMNYLAGKIAFVTGAGSGIGRAACQLLAKNGAKIIASDCNINSAKETINLIQDSSNNKHLSLKVDVTKKANIENALKSCLDVFKTPPNVIVNCAGITRDNFVLKLSEEDFDTVININLKGTFLVTQVFASALIDVENCQGSFINLASIVGKNGNIGQSNYASSKAAIEAFTKSTAKEFGKFNIRCNAILPGFIDTPMVATVPNKVKDMVMKLIAMKRFGKPEEIAEVIVFLASDKSSYINGSCIEVTGGYL